MSSPQDAIIGTLDRWIIEDAPFISLDYKTPSEVFGKEYKAILRSEGWARVEKFAAYGAIPGLQQALVAMKEEWKSAFPTATPYKIYARNIGQRFCTSVLEAPWEERVNDVRRAERATLLDTEKMKDCARAAKNITNTPELYAHIESTFRPQTLPFRNTACPPATAPEEERALWNLATWSYVTDIADVHDLDTFHTAISPRVRGYFPVKSDHLFASLFTHVASELARSSPSYDYAMLESAVEVIHESHTIADLKPFREDRNNSVTSEDVSQRIDDFRSRVFKRLGAKYALDAGVKFCDATIPVSDALKDLWALALVSGLWFFENPAQVENVLDGLKWGSLSMVLAEFVRRRRPEFGSFYGNVRTLVMTPRMRKEVHRCLPLFVELTTMANRSS